MGSKSCRFYVKKLEKRGHQIPIWIMGKMLDLTHLYRRKDIICCDCLSSVFSGKVIGTSCDVNDKDPSSTRVSSRGVLSHICWAGQGILQDSPHASQWGFKFNGSRVSAFGRIGRHVCKGVKVKKCGASSRWQKWQCDDNKAETIALQHSTCLLLFETKFNFCGKIFEDLDGRTDGQIIQSKGVGEQVSNFQFHCPIISIPNFFVIWDDELG